MIPVFVVLSGSTLPAFEDMRTRKQDQPKIDSFPEPSQISGRAKFVEDIHLLYGILPIVGVMGRNPLLSKLPVVDDMILLAMDHNKESKTRLWCVLATQLLLDVHHALGPSAERAAERLQETARGTRRTIEYTLEHLETSVIKDKTTISSLQSCIPLTIVEEMVENDIVSKTCEDN